MGGCCGKAARRSYDVEPFSEATEARALPPRSERRRAQSPGFTRFPSNGGMGNDKSRPAAGGGLAGIGVGKRGPGVKELVDRAQKTGVLKLSKAGLKEIPTQLSELSALLRNLDLASNRLTTVPPFIGAFALLKQLHLDHNRISELPDEIGALKKLETLSLAENELIRLPDTLIGCLALKTLNVAGNRLHALPHAVSHLPALEMADVSGNRLTTLPDDVGSCRAVELNLNRNQLGSLNATRLALAPRLKVLRVEENCLGIAEMSPELLAQSNISLITIDGNLFQEREFRESSGYDEYMEKFTASKKKMY